jgi:hypothetical protein
MRARQGLVDVTDRGWYRFISARVSDLVNFWLAGELQGPPARRAVPGSNSATARRVLYTGEGAYGADSQGRQALRGAPEWQWTRYSRLDDEIAESDAPTLRYCDLTVLRDH